MRFTSAVSDDLTAARLAAAVARGDLATWPYDAAFAARASAPERILAEARSIVCLAVAYGDGATVPPRVRDDGGGGRISLYARGEDYHGRMRALARVVAREIDAIAGAPATLAGCDTLPLAERAFAARAGLGWIGKHTNLIAPELGSYVFLAEIVTTLDIGADAPRATHCGACTRCVDVCPTGALRGDYTMDATRCISDLTQRRDAIPRELRPLVGTWIWGCDLCQEVCPPTRLARDRRRLPPAAAESVDLRALLRLRSAEFERSFRPTALGWRGATILRRNAAVALGNALDRGAVPALVEALGADPHPLVRGHVAWALGRIGSPAALEALAARATSEPDASAREEIAAALAAYQGKPPRPFRR